MDVDERLARIEAILEIERLQYAYGEACDDGYPPDRLGEMFTADARWVREFAGEGAGKECIGRAAIEEHFAATPMRFLWGSHNCMPVQIDVSPGAQSAVGRWRLQMPCVLLFDGEPRDFWISGRYRNDYVVEDGRWRFKTVRMIYDVATPVDAAWPARAIDRTYLDG